MNLEMVKYRMKEALSGHKKGQANLGGLMGAFIGIGVALLGAAFVVLILSDVGSTMTADSAEYNVTQTGITTIGDMTDLVQPLGVVVIAVVIIGVLLHAFAGRRR